MTKFVRFLPLATVLVFFPLLCGCGGNGKAAPVTETQPPAQVTVAIAEDSVNLGAGETHQFTATVTGSSNTSVTWSISGCSGSACGTISPTGLYTAPSSIPGEVEVTVKATSQADATKFDTVKVCHMPVTVSIAPQSAMVSPGAKVYFVADIRHDCKNEGVTWALAPACSTGMCGALSDVTLNSIAYTAPATVPNPPTVTLTATSIRDPNKTAEVTLTISVTRALTEGDYAFLFDGWEIRYSSDRQTYVPARVAAAGHFHADAKGHITDAVKDINSSSGVSQAVPFTGTYNLGPDGRGTFQITTAKGTETYNMTVNPSGTKGKFIKSDALPLDAPIFGTGYFELQDKSAFSSSALAGDYVVGLSGTSQEWNRVAALGRFTASPSGPFSQGKMDVTIATHAGADQQADFKSLTLTGSFSAPSTSTGRGTAKITLAPNPDRVTGPFDFVYYIIGSQKILLVQSDPRSSNVPVLSGEVRRQNGAFSTASFNAPIIFSMSGVNRANYGVVLNDIEIGQMTPSTPGSLTSIIDNNQGGSEMQFTGTYDVASNGRATIQLHRNMASETAIAYFYDANEGFLMETVGTDVLFGNFEPQAPGPFTAASVVGTFLTATEPPPGEEAENDTGLATFDGVGAVTSIMDATDWDGLHHLDLTGTYDVAANGRGTLAFASSAIDQPVVFWVISPAELVAIGPNALLNCER